MTNATTNQIRYGSSDPLPEVRTLHAGPVTAMLEGGDLRYVCLGNIEIIRRLYVAVRDRNWGTIAPTYTQYELEEHDSHFRLQLTAEHVSGDVDFVWHGVIEGNAEGTIRYTMDGVARSPFMRNRIGFCVLHPSDLAGTAVVTETPNGMVEGAFPDLISPDQPFVDMLTIAHPVGESAVTTITFTGDLFEMEDQRNWTDASYKTYSTPLRLPYPVEVTPDQSIQQSVSLSVSGGMPTVTAEETSRLHVNIDFTTPRALPPIGFGAGLAGTIESEDMARLSALAPSHLWENLDLGAKSWEPVIAHAVERSTALNAPLHLSVVASSGRGGGWAALAKRIKSPDANVEQIFVFPTVNDPITFPRKDLATHQKTIDAARKAFNAANLLIPLGGGSRAYFTELNRSTSFLPVADLDAITFTVNPQIHAFDNRSVVETLLAQGDVVRSARVIAGERPLLVGPVTFKAPWNPNATGPAPDTRSDELSTAVDPRQMSLFGAGWTIGSIYQLAAAGVEGITFYELYGWRGVLEREHDLTHREQFPSEPGQLFPLYHVFVAVQEFAGGEIAGIEVSAPLDIAAMGLRKDGKHRLLLASFREDAVLVEIGGIILSGATLRLLDESSYAAALSNPRYFLEGGQPLPVVEDGSTIELPPFAVACIDVAN